MTQAMATVFEQAIREHPEDWHMLQKLFVADLDPERLARSRARNGNGDTRNGNGDPRGRLHRDGDRGPWTRADRHRVPVLLGRARAACSSTSGTWPRR